jgi:alanyl aminopeptidase
MTVVANTPVESTVETGGHQRVTFQETKPLASYLLAFAVGPLDRVPLEGLSVPGHIYTPRGGTDKLGFVLRETPGIVAGLEEYFGLRYPFEKLDFVAVPDFAFGAMENPGLITYRTDLLMVGDNVSGDTAETVLMVIAHEVAHIWYGDLVTMEWWNDLWLNEAFASWMAWSIIERLYPQYESRLNLPQTSAFAADQSSASRAIRRTVRNSEDVFAGVRLHYSKGRTLLRMLEAYVGAETWQRAIRKYVERYAWDNATEKDLWATVSEVSGLDIGAIAGAYLNQPGFALVSIDADGKIRQQRYVLPGNEAPNLSWQVPLNIKYSKDGEIRQTFYLLEDQSGTADLPEGTEWIFPDAGGNGYFRWETDLERFYALVDDVDRLGDRERIALLDNSEALFSIGKLSLADYLYVVERLLRDPHPLVFLPALEGVKTIGDEFVDDSTRVAFGRFVDGVLGDRLEAIGLDTRSGDSEAILQMRPRLLRVLGEYGANRGVREGAAALAARYLAKPDSVDSDLANEALRVTALHDDGSMYDDYISAYLGAKKPVDKSAILDAVYFDEPEIVASHLDFLLTDAVQGRDAAKGVTLYADVIDDNTPVFAWLEENFDALTAKIPDYLRSRMPQVVGGGCSEASLDRLRNFFDGRDGVETSLHKATLTARACIDRRQRHVADLERFLDGQ